MKISLFCLALSSVLATSVAAIEQGIPEHVHHDKPRKLSKSTKAASASSSTTAKSTKSSSTSTVITASPSSGPTLSDSPSGSTSVPTDSPSVTPQSSTSTSSSSVKSAKSVSSSAKSVKTSSPSTRPTTAAPSLSMAPTKSPVPPPPSPSSSSSKSAKSTKSASTPATTAATVSNAAPATPSSSSSSAKSAKSVKSASTPSWSSKSTKSSSQAPPFSTVVSANGEALTSCQITAIPSTAISVTNQQLDWSFGFTSSNGDVSDSILMRVENDIIDEYLSCDYFNGDAWHVASVWFNRNEGATCTNVGGNNWECTHSFRLEVVEMPTTRALQVYAGRNKKDRQLSLVTTLSQDSTTFTRVTNTLTNILNGLGNAFGITSIAFNGLTNSDATTTTTMATTTSTTLPANPQVIEEVVETTEETTTAATTTTTTTSTEDSVVEELSSTEDEEPQDIAFGALETDTVTERSDGKNVHVAAVLSAAFGAFFVVAIAAVVSSRRLRRTKCQEAERGQPHVLMEDNGEGLEVSLEKNNIVLDSATTFDTDSEMAEEESSIDGPTMFNVASGEGNIEDATLERLHMPSYDSDDDEVPTERNVEFIKCHSDPDQLRSVMRDLVPPTATEYKNEEESLREYDHHDTVVL